MTDATAQLSAAAAVMSDCLAGFADFAEEVRMGDADKIMNAIAIEKVSQNGNDCRRGLRAGTDFDFIITSLLFVQITQGGGQHTRPERTGGRFLHTCNIPEFWACGEEDYN
jgi:hypothetical protein